MRYTFEDLVLDPERRELMHGPHAVAVGPQVFDLLLCLVRNRGRVVSKDELLDEVWGGRIVSESTVTSHINAARKAVSDSGHEQRLIRTIARKGFRFVGDVGEERHSEIMSAEAEGIADAKWLSTDPLTPPKGPSIAVLPFLNLSGDPGQDYFADGVVEDIITELSRIGWLFVIARNSSFSYKGRSVDVKQIGRELGVRYVLEGSLRRAATRVRITGQLVDATTGQNLWAERFEGAPDDIFELQDQLASSVVGAIAPQLERAEIGRAKRKPTESLDAYDYYLRGMASFHQLTRAAIDEALPLFYRAAALDPSFASAYGMAAWCYFWRKINGWMTDRTQETAEGARLARRSIELGRNDAVALTRGGHALGHFGGDLEGCMTLLDRALVLNPNLSAAWYLSGFQRIAHGDPDEAIDRIAHAIRLSPLDPEMVRMQTGIAMAHLFALRFDSATEWAAKAYRELPSFLLAVAVLAAGQALAGRVEEARASMWHMRRLEPALRASDINELVILHRPQDLSTLIDGLQRAGLPD